MILWVALAFLVLLLAGYGIFIFFVMISIWTGAPYVPSSRTRTRRMLELAMIQPGERIADLGSGDGRLLRAAANSGAHVVGWELNPVLVVWSRLVARVCGQGGRTVVHLGSFWSAPVGEFDVLFLYLLPQTMERLGEKIRREAKPGARIIVNAFPIHGWPLDAEDGHVYRYLVR